MNRAHVSMYRVNCTPKTTGEQRVTIDMYIRVSRETVATLPAEYKPCV